MTHARTPKQQQGVVKELTAMETYVKQNIITNYACF